MQVLSRVVLFNGRLYGTNSLLEIFLVGIIGVIRKLVLHVFPRTFCVTSFSDYHLMRSGIRVGMNEPIKSGLLVLAVIFKFETEIVKNVFLQIPFIRKIIFKIREYFVTEDSNDEQTDFKRD